MTENDFDYVKNAFKNGDPRPLANWVLQNKLTKQQREFVAKAILGDIEQIDRRVKPKPTTKEIVSFYERNKYLNYMLGCFDSDAPKMKDSEMVRILADRLGYDDPDSVRRAITRHKKRMREVIPTKKQVLRTVGRTRKKIVS